MEAVISSLFAVVLEGEATPQKQIVVPMARSYQIVHAFITAGEGAKITLIRRDLTSGEETAFACLLVGEEGAVDRPMEIINTRASHIPGRCVTVITVGLGCVRRVVLHCVGSPSQALPLE
jgi:hypothetical protein